MNKLAIVLLFSALTMTGCDEYLSTAPDSRQEIFGLKDLSDLLVFAYSRGSWQFVVRGTDNARAIDEIQPGDIFRQRIYQFKTVENNKEPETLWVSSYAAIAQANLVLNNIDRVPNTDPSLKSSLKGEALLCRAYAHFILANIFCQHYSESTKSGLGIPYVTKVQEDFLPQYYSRGTLEATYTNIEKDLLAGLSLMADEDRIKGSEAKFRFNKKSGLAFASRYYLFKSEYDKCIVYADSLLGTGALSETFIRNDEKVIYPYQRLELASNFQNPELPSNLLLFNYSDCVNCTADTERYASTGQLFDELFDDSIQKGVDWRDVRTGIVIKPFYPRYIAKYWWGSYVPWCELRSEEVIFNRMEGLVRTGKLQRALDDYNVLARFRYANGGQLDFDKIERYYARTTNTRAQALLAFVIEERRKEFFWEGLRWFDIKRLGLKIIHQDGKETFSLSEASKAIQIPFNAHKVGGLEKNPGYMTEAN